jgi:hypothetical protein
MGLCIISKLNQKNNIFGSLDGIGDDCKMTEMSLSSAGIWILAIPGQVMNFYEKIN